MKTLALLLGAALFASPLPAQIRIGTDSINFLMDTTTYHKLDDSKDWIFEVTPKPVVVAYWYEIAHCERLAPKDGLRHIRFFIVNATDFGGLPPLVSYLGFTIPRGNGFEIYLAITIAGRKDIIQHEMTHVLMWLNGMPVSHPQYIFERCGLHTTG